MAACSAAETEESERDTNLQNMKISNEAPRPGQPGVAAKSRTVSKRVSAV